MTGEEKALVNAEINIFFQVRGFKGHTKLLVPGTPTEATYTAMLDRIEAMGGIPEGAELPGKAAEAPAGSDDVPPCDGCGGPMQYRKGVSKAGKSYAGWFCSKRNCKGTPIWENDD